MATIHDVAAYILTKRGAMTAMKLQKLAYYSQAWHLVWDEELLFDARFEAWANGPVAPELYQHHRGQFRVSAWPAGDPDALTPAEKESVDVVLKEYGRKSAQELSDLTHRESPWKDARAGYAPGQRSSVEITPAAMDEYYGGLGPSDT